MPALLCANFACWADSLQMIKAAGASMVHLDVMDGHFAPEITVGQPVVASVRRGTDLILDVHLLIERPERFVVDFIEAGADRIAVHPEATAHLHRILDVIRRAGAEAGAALSPATPLDSVSEVLPELDFLTVVAADVGAEKEAFIPGALEKVRAAFRRREEQRLDFAIEVEGGVNDKNLEALVRAGADILVVGPAIFHNQDPRARLVELMRMAASSRQISRVC